MKNTNLQNAIGLLKSELTFARMRVKGIETALSVLLDNEHPAPAPADKPNPTRKPAPKYGTCKGLRPAVDALVANMVPGSTITTRQAAEALRPRFRAVNGNLASYLRTSDSLVFVSKSAGPRGEVVFRKEVPIAQPSGELVTA